MASSQQSIATLLARVKESYESDRLIKISGTYDFELSRFHDINQFVRDLVLRITKISSLGDPLTQLIGMAGGRRPGCRPAPNPKRRPELWRFRDFPHRNASAAAASAAARGAQFGAGGNVGRGAEPFRFN